MEDFSHLTHANRNTKTNLMTTALKGKVEPVKHERIWKTLVTLLKQIEIKNKSDDNSTEGKG